MKQTSLLSSLSAFAALAATGHAAAQAEIDVAPPSELTAGPATVSDVAPDGAVAAPVAPTFYQPVDTTPPRWTDEEIAALGPVRMAFGSPHDRLYFDVVEGVHWVRGRTYKASADARGFTFIPFLGSSASQNWPVRFRVAEITVGGVPIALEGAATVVRDGDDIVLQRGAVDVRYEIELDQVEQIFRVSTGRLVGDLVVTLDVTGELGVEPAGGGFRFSGPDGGFDYGAAIALDGAGGTVEVPAAYEAGQLRLTVPAAFVAAAGGEVLIDPILSSWSITTASDLQRDVDAAYDRTADAFAFVYEDVFSATDTDVFIRVLEIDGTPLDERSIDFTTADWIDPEVAGLNGEDVMLVVATRNNAADDEIVGRIYDVASLTTGTGQFVIADTGSGTNTWSNARPDVGGNGTSASGGRFLVTWERTFASIGSTLPRHTTVDGAGNVGGLLFLIGSGSDIRCTQFRVSESTGNSSTTNVWNVAFAYEDTSTSEEEIRVAQINADGSVATPMSTLLDVGTGEIIRALDVSDALIIDGLDPTFLVTYDNFAVSDEDVTAVICRNGSFVNKRDINLREHAILSRNQNGPRLSTTVDQFVVSYVEFDAGEWTTYVTAMDLVQGNQIAINERRTALSPTNTAFPTDGPGLASRFSGGVNSRYVGIGWETVGFDGDIAGANFFASNPDSPAWQYCDGTVNSTGDRGFLRLEGSRAANTNKTARASALPPFQFALLVSGTGFANVPNTGGGQGTLCLGGSLGRYNAQLQAIAADGTVSFTINPANIPLGAGFTTAVPGNTFQWQVWHRDIVPAGQTSNLSNAVSLRFN